MASKNEIIGKGAEAIIYLKTEGEHSGQCNVIKDRVKKNYRIPEIDVQFRKFRTRREAKILEKAQSIEGFYAPKLISMDDKGMLVTMEHISGQKLRDVLEASDYRDICKRIGIKVARMHAAGIIHSDLTTSNMILSEKNKKIYFIDFGLGYFSEKIEDRAVDLHLLRQALESKHYTIWEECFESVLEGYKQEMRKKEYENKSNNEGRNFEAIVKRLIVVENRGRYKHKTDYYTKLYGKLFKT